MLGIISTMSILILILINLILRLILIHVVIIMIIDFVVIIVAVVRVMSLPQGCWATATLPVNQPIKEGGRYSRT